MSLAPAYGGGEGAGFQLFTQSDNDPGIYADDTERDTYFSTYPDELTRLDNNQFLIIKLLDNGSGEIAYQQRSGGNWVDVTSLVQGEDGGSTNFAGITKEGAVPSLSFDLVNYEYSGATVDSNGVYIFDKKIEIPASTLVVGETTNLSACTGALIVENELTASTSNILMSTFDSAGASEPVYFDVGAEAVINLQTDFSESLTTNPLTFSDVGGVVAPDIRQINAITIKTGGAMTNARAKITDNATGVTLRYIPSKAEWDEGTGLSLISGDNLFDFLSTAADSSGVFNLGVQPFLIEEGQVVDFEFRADSMNLLGNSSDIPYMVANAQDGPLVKLADKESADRHQTTGLLEGGVISIASSSTVSWTAGRGIVTDYSDPENPNPIDVIWGSVSGIAPASLSTDGTTLFGYDSTGSIEMRLSTAITIEDAHDVIWFGSATHISSTIVSVLTAPGNLAYDGIGSFTDFINLIIGPANADGNIYGANGSNMNIDVIGGNAYMIGSNFRTNPALSDIKPLISDTALSFQKVYKSAGAGLSVIYDGVPTDTIDPSQYDDGSGTLATTTAGYWTIQRIFRSRSGGTFIAYGQEEFSTKSLALEALGKETFIEKSPLPFMLYRCSLLVVQGASDLSDTAEAEFHTQSSFRISGAQSSTTSIPGITSPGGVDTSIQYNSGGVFGGDTKFTYNSSTNEVTIDGKLTVTGLIDPTGMVLTEQESVPDTPTDGYGYLWVKDTTPSTMIFTDDAGTDHLLEAGGGDVTGPVSSTQFGIATYADTSGKVLLNNPRVIIHDDLSITEIRLTSGDSFGDAIIRLDNSVSDALFVIDADDDSDTVTIEATSNVSAFTIDNQATDIDTVLSVTGDASIDISATGANTNPPLRFASLGSNGAIIQVFSSIVAPEGVITGNPGDICIFKDGVDSRMFQLESASAGNTGWTSQEGGDVDGPASSTQYGIATYYDTSGKVLVDNPRAVIHDDSAITELILTSGDSGGDAKIKLRNYLNTLLFEIDADDDSDTVSIEATSDSTSFIIANRATDVDMELVVTGDAAVDIVSPGANTNPPFRIASVGTSGAVIQFFTSTVSPEGVITGNPGDLCFFKSGVSSELFQLKSASAGNTGWTGFDSGGDVSGPVTTIVNTIPTWGDTSGGSLLANDTAFLTTSGSSTGLTLESPSASGTAIIAFKDSNDSLMSALEYVETSDRTQILDYSGSGMDLGSDIGLVSCRSLSATHMWLDVESPNATSFQSGFRILNSTDDADLVITLDEIDDETRIVDSTANGLSIETDSGQLYFGSDAGDQNIVTIKSTGASSFSSFRIDDSSLATQLELKYDETADETSITYENPLRLITTDSTLNHVKLVSPSASGFGIYQILNSTETIAFSMKYGESADVAILQDNTGTGIDILTSKRVRIETAVSHTNPVLELKTTGTGSGDIGIHVGSDNPEGTITGTPGSLYVREDGVDSTQYIHDAASSGTTGWKPQIKGSLTASTAKSLAYYTDTSGANIDSHPQLLFDDTGPHINLDLYPASAIGATQIGCWNLGGTNGTFFNWVDNTDTGEFDMNDTGIHAKSDPDDSFIDVKSKSATGSARVRVKNFADTKSILLDIDDTNDIQSIWCGTGITAESGTISSKINIDSNSASGLAYLNLRNSSDANRLTMQYSESSNTASLVSASGTDLNFNMGANLWIGTLSGNKVTISSAGANTNSPLELAATGTDGASSHFFLSDVTPIGAIPGAPGDICIQADAGTSSALYIHKGSSIDSTSWKKMHAGANPVTKSYSMANVGTLNFVYYGGFYEAPADEVVLTIGGTVTETYGASNRSTAAHAFCVASGAGGTDLVLTVSGTSITDAGVRTTSDSEIIVADTDAAITDQYFETSKKWLGVVTYTLTGSSGSFTFNYGFAKYEDFRNVEFEVDEFEVVGLSDVNADVNFELLLHDGTGWTYSAGSFVPGGTVICAMATDHSTDDQIDADANFAYKRIGLGVAIDGTSGEGVIAKYSCTTNNSLLHGDIHIGVNVAA